MRCDEKVAFRSAAKARQAIPGARWIARLHGEPAVQAFYECACGAFHLTKRAPNGKHRRST